MPSSREDAGIGLGIVAIVVLAIIVQSVSTQTNYCATSDTNLELSLLSKLPNNQTESVNQDLLSSAYWQQVLSSADSTLAGILPNTAVGLFSSYQDSRNWTLANMPNPPSWISTGALPYLELQVLHLQENVTSSGDPTQARATLNGFFASVSGASLTALDFVSFGGITGLRTYFETGSQSQAICATFPGQLAELYILSGSAKVDSNQRAQFLGEALAITTIMVALAGHDDFSEKFNAALDKVGLSDSWATVKPYLSQILTKVSQKAAMLTLAVLQKVAQRFPQDAAWFTGMTAYRIVSLTDVLQENGVPTTEIESKIQGLVHAANNAQNGDDAATAADVAAYQSTKEIEVVVRHHNELYLYFDGKSRSQPMSTEFLSRMLPDFVPGQNTIFRVTYWDSPGVVNEVVYHYYQGGDNWIPTVPDEVAQRGDVLTISFQILSTDQFVVDLPNIDYTNLQYDDWGGFSTSLTSFKLNGDDMQIQATNWPEYAGVTSFAIDGKVTGPLTFVSGTTSLDVRLTDAFGQTRDVRINYDGHSAASLGIWDSDSFAAVQFVSFDGIRLRFATVPSSNNVDIATIYVNQPSSLYSLAPIEGVNLGFHVDYASQTFQIEQVDFTRHLEVQMLKDGTRYDVGRLGAEIAYTVGIERLGLKDLIMFEPNMGGNDLITADGNTIIQARMITTPEHAVTNQNDLIAEELNQMTNKLHKGFQYNPQATAGYAILAYVDYGGIVRVVIVQVLP